MNTAEIKGRLDLAEVARDHGVELRREGSEFRGLCIFHEDHNPSLYINPEKQTWLCRSACGKGGDVIDFLGHATYNGSWNKRDPEQFKNVLGEAARRAGVAVRNAPHKEPSRIVATYDYCDADGSIAYQVVRLEPKAFRQRRPDPDSPDGWSWRIIDKSTGKRLVDPLPYRLPELLDAPDGVVVFVGAGEKDTDRIAQEGFVATTNSGGEGNWSPSINRYFAGRDVVILEDNDDKGRAHAETVAQNLLPVAKSVRVLALPGLPVKGDVSDWLDAGNACEDLFALAGKCPPYESPRKASTLDARLRLADELLSAVLPEPRFVIPGLLPEGATVLAGKPKMGKSWMALQIALAMALGGKALGQDVSTSDVLYLALEDNWRRVQSRVKKQLYLDSASAPALPGLLTFATEWPRLDQGGLGDIYTWLQAHPDAGLVVIDTFARIRPSRSSNANTYDEDYAALAGLQGLAGEFNVGILVIHHLRKMTSDDPLDLVSGTLGLTAAADSVWILRRERGRADATMFVTGRDIEEQDLALQFDQQLAVWSVLGDADEYRRTKESDEIVQVLRDAEQLLSPAEIAERLGINGNTARQRLYKMSKRGEVSSKDGKYGCV